LLWSPASLSVSHPSKLPFYRNTDNAHLTFNVFNKMTELQPH
jgi:hypothetical protein